MVLKHSKDGLPYHEPPYSKAELRDLEARIYQTPVSITRPVWQPRRRQQQVHQNREHLAPTLRLVQANDSGPTATKAELKDVCGQKSDSPMTWLGATLKTVTGASGEHHQIMNTGLRLNLSEERMESMITGLVAVCENLPGEDEMHYLAHALLYNMRKSFEDAGPMIESISPCYWYTEPPRPAVLV